MKSLNGVHIEHLRSEPKKLRDVDQILLYASRAIIAAREFSLIAPINMTTHPDCVCPLKGALVEAEEVGKYVPELYDRHAALIHDGAEVFMAYFVTSRLSRRPPMSTDQTLIPAEKEDPAIRRNRRREHHDNKHSRLFSEPTGQDTAAEDSRPQAEALDPQWTDTRELPPADGRHYAIP